MAQELFDIYWTKGSNNHADYWTKHFATVYCKTIHSLYVQDKEYTHDLHNVFNLTHSLF